MNFGPVPTTIKHRTVPLPRYVALLRAINVGGHVVKMDALRATFADLGFTDVTTFIASGNVLFTAGRAKSASLEDRIALALEAKLGYAVATFLRTGPELSTAAARVPVGSPVDGETISVGFLGAPLDAAGRRALAAFNTDVDDFTTTAREVYWRCRVRSADSTFTIRKFESAIGQPATFRNITTVRKLAALLDAAPVKPKRPSR